MNTIARAESSAYAALTAITAARKEAAGAGERVTEMVLRQIEEEAGKVSDRLNCLLQAARAAVANRGRV